MGGSRMESRITLIPPSRMRTNDDKGMISGNGKSYRDMESYKKAYLQLVASVGDSLKSTDIEKLAYFRKESLSSCRTPAQADMPWTGLGILRALEEVGDFNYVRVDGLASAMSDVKREDQKKVVDEFVAAHQDLLSSGVLGGRHVLQGIPVTETEVDGPYLVSRHKIKAENDDMTTVDICESDDDCYEMLAPPSKPSKFGSKGSAPTLSSHSLPDAKTPSPPEDENEEYSYPYVRNTITNGAVTTVSPESSLSSTSSAAMYSSIISSDSKTGADGSSDDDETDSYQSSRDSWLTTATLKLIQRLHLKTTPLQSMIRKHENHTLTGDVIKWQLKNSISLVLKLHIDPIGSHNGIAAKLVLQKQTRTIITGVLTAELTICQKKLKSKSKNLSMSPTLTLFHSSVVMEMPDENTSPNTPVIVAHFPMILSHKVLFNDKLITSSSLDMILTLRQIDT